MKSVYWHCLNPILAITLLALLSGCNQTYKVPSIKQTIDVPIYPDDSVFDSASGDLYVVAGFGESVVRIEPNLKQTEIPLPSPKPFSGRITLNPVTHLVYAIGDLGNLVHVISQSRVIASLPLASYDSSDIVSDATSPLVFVTSHLAAKMAPNTPMVGAPRITIISGTAVINSIDTTPYRPQRMAFDPHFKLLYVVATGGPTVDDASILVIQDGKIIKRETTRQSIETYVVDPMTGDMYTGGSTIFHFRNGEIVEKLELSESTPLHRGRNIRSLILNSKENLLYAIDFVYAEVFVIRNMREIGKIKLNGAIFKSVLDPTTGNVYVADFNGNAVTAINATRVLTTYHTGVYPYGVTVNPQNGWVYVSNSKSKTITVLGY